MQLDGRFDGSCEVASCVATSSAPGGDMVGCDRVLGVGEGIFRANCFSRILVV